MLSARRQRDPVFVSSALQHLLASLEMVRHVHAPLDYPHDCRLALSIDDAPRAQLAARPLRANTLQKVRQLPPSLTIHNLRLEL